MKTLNLIKAVTSMAVLLAGTTALSAPVLTLGGKTQISSIIAQPLRIPVLQQIDPVFTARFAAASKDYKTFHGSMCQPFYGTQQGDIQHRDNGLYNTSTGTRTVVCPIVRDNVHKKTGVWAYVYINNPPNKTFSCWMDSRGKFGNVIQWVNKQTNLQGNRTLSIDVKNMVAHGNFNLYCRVPAKGRIASYETVELLRTDLNN